MRSKLVPIDQVRAWASQLAGETRDPDWLNYSYVVPDVLQDVAQELVHVKRGLIGLVGRQGVGKSSALMALAKGKPFSVGSSRVLFKWRSEEELFQSLLDFSHEAADYFMLRYVSSLLGELASRSRSMGQADALRLSRFIEASKQLVERAQGPSVSDITWAEGRLGKATVKALRRDAWLSTVRGQDVILIDTPDYSKTDKRRIDRDLEEIYWFWNKLMSLGSISTIVVAIQQEMFRGHFFLDKMKKFELMPLPPEKMVEAYRLRFKSIYPFSEDALLTLARMSRGIFRRYLRYITCTVDFWQRPNHSAVIDQETVRKAVPTERLAEDMELEFLGLFPKHSELRSLAVRVLLYLEENGPQKQSQLARALDTEPFAISRVLTKLESSRHVTRIRRGIDKVVSLPAPL